MSSIVEAEKKLTEVCKQGLALSAAGDHAGAYEKAKEALAIAVDNGVPRDIVATLTFIALAEGTAAGLADTALVAA